MDLAGRPCHSPAFSPPSSPPPNPADPADPADAAELSRLLIQQAELCVQIRRRYRDLKTVPDTRYFTYSLLLQDGYIYIGNSDNIYQRLSDHFGMTPHSAQWVREHGPVVRVLEIIRNSSSDDELYKTLEWCDMMGHTRVRGATYCRLVSPTPPPSLASFRRESARVFEYMSRAEIDEIGAVARRLAAVVP